MQKVDLRIIFLCIKSLLLCNQVIVVDLYSMRKEILLELFVPIILEQKM